MTKLHSKILWVGYFISFHLFLTIINWIYIFFLSQSGIHIPIRIFEPFLKQGFGIRAKSIVAKEVGICNILFWYGPISKTDARNPRLDCQKKSYFYYYYNFPIFSIDSFFFLFFFSKPCLLFISWNRTLGRKFEDNSYISSCTICCFPLFSSHLDSNVSSTCHIPLAIDHHRNGSNIFLLRTGTFNWQWGMEVSFFTLVFQKKI